MDIENMLEDFAEWMSRHLLKIIAMLVALFAAMLVHFAAHAQDDGSWVAPSYLQRSLDKVIIYKDGTAQTLRMPPGSGTSYLYLDDEDERPSTEEEIEEFCEDHDCD